MKIKSNNFSIQQIICYSILKRYTVCWGVGEKKIEYPCEKESVRKNTTYAERCYNKGARFEICAILVVMMMMMRNIEFGKHGVLLDATTCLSSLTLLPISCNDCRGSLKVGRNSSFAPISIAVCRLLCS